MTPLRLDDVVARRHRSVSAVLSDGLSVKCLNTDWAQPDEKLDNCKDDTQIIQLPEPGDEIWNEINRRDDVQKTEQWNYLEQERHSRLTQEPECQSRVGEQRAHVPGPGKPG